MHFGVRYCPGCFRAGSYSGRPHGRVVLKMRRAIWKYDVPFVRSDQKVEIEMPLGSRIVHVGDQTREAFLSADHPLTIWVEVDPDEVGRPIKHWFQIFGTGHDIPYGGKDHIGTVVRHQFVWHLYHNCELNKYADGGY